jgi:hypothetical protein
MFNYLAFIHGGIQCAGESALEDGKALANQCLTKLAELDNEEQFPPQLLILLVSASYLENDSQLDEIKARQLIGGVHRAFSERVGRTIPLIGSSVSAVFFDGAIHRDGAILICLASRLLDVKVSVGPQVSTDPEASVKKLLDGLDIQHSLDDYPRPLPNRALLTFFPGSEAGPTARNSTDKLHALLLEKLTYRIPIVGGVSSAGYAEPRKRSLQFVNRQAFSDSLAGCLILSGVPLSTSMAKGLQSTGRMLRVKKLSDDGKTIKEFHEGTFEEIFKGETKPILLRDLSPANDVVRAKSLPDQGYSVVNVLRELQEGAVLEVTIPDPDRMYAETKKAHGVSLERASMKHPAGCLSFKCSGHLAYSNELGLQLETGIAAMQKKFGIPSYVGGFFDGEIGTDNAGGSICGGWSVAGLIFGDELSERTAVHAGFDSLAKHGVKLAGTFELDIDLQQSLELIFDLGFPGAMISILMPDREKKRFIPIKAKGRRFERLFDLMRNGEGDPISHFVERHKKPYFVGSSDGRETNEGDIGQYLMPLFDPEGNTFGILRVDLGMAPGRNDIHPASEKVLKPVAAIVGAAINRIFTWEENNIARKLDKALKDSLTSEDFEIALRRFLHSALKVFGLSMGHIRLFNEKDNALRLGTGFGEYYRAAKKYRVEPNINRDWSPSCEAFVENKIIIINDARKSRSHRDLAQSYSENPEMTQVLQHVGSYANVPFDNERRKKFGTISLLSSEAWFFTSFHEAALAALKRRMDFLVSYFTRKEREKEARNQLSFLLDVSPKLYRIPNFNELHDILREATQNFAKAVHGQYASLYVWDESQAQYILRAEYGWRSKDWLDAARYEKGSQWIGGRLLEKPILIADLRKYYMENQYAEPSGRYASYIFGRELSENFAVEAIAVPLVVSGERLGALTLYRQCDPAQAERESGFSITDAELLQEGGNHLAGLVKLLLSHQTGHFDRIAQTRLEEVQRTFDAKEQTKIFEERVSEKVLRVFDATEADFYTLQNPDSSSQIEWVCGFRKISSRSNERIPKVSPDDIVNEVARIEAFKSVPIVVPQDQRTNPRRVAREGFTQRACIPLVAGWLVVGVLDVRWDVEGPNDPSLTGKSGERRLVELGHSIGSAYWKARSTLKEEAARAEAEQSRLAVQAVGAMVFQTAHRLTNLVQKIYRLSLSIKEAESEASRNEYLERLFAAVALTRKELKWPMDVPQRIQQLTRERCCIRQLIDQVLEELRPFEIPIDELVSVPEDLVLLVNPELTKEALVNLINNAVRAMEDKRGGTLRIWEGPDNGKTSIIIEDTGVGMTQEEIQNVMKGFVVKEGHTGVGVLISSVLLHVQGGTLNFDSVKDVGTKAIITLPNELGDNHGS